MKIFKMLGLSFGIALISGCFLNFSADYTRGPIETSVFTCGLREDAMKRMGLTPCTIKHRNVTAEDGREGVEIIELDGYGKNNNVFTSNTREEAVRSILDAVLPDERMLTAKKGAATEIFSSGKGSTRDVDIIIVDGVEYSYNPKDSGGPLLEINGNGTPKLWGSNEGVVYNCVIERLGIYDRGIKEGLFGTTVTYRDEGTKKMVQENTTGLNSKDLKYRKEIRNVKLSGNITKINRSFLSIERTPFEIGKTLQLGVRTIDMGGVNPEKKVTVKCGFCNECENVTRFVPPPSGLIVYSDLSHCPSEYLRDKLEPFKGKFTDKNYDNDPIVAGENVGGCCAIM